jgi:hypothetical protein
MENLCRDHPNSRRRSDCSQQNHGREASPVSEAVLDLAIEY